MSMDDGATKRFGSYLGARTYVSWMQGPIGITYINEIVVLNEKVITLDFFEVQYCRPLPAEDCFFERK